MDQSAIFEIIGHRIATLMRVKTKPVRIAINGIEGTGKTTFAEALSGFLLSQNLNAIQVSIDGFHHNREHRYRQGKDSARGYYEDSYDEATFVEKVLKASQTSKPHYTAATHDLHSDRYVDDHPISIPDGTILITDGAYLFKPAFREHWDLKIYLKTDFDIALERGAKRDKVSLGGYEQAREKYMHRYHAASKIYISENDPESIADMIINNTDFDQLYIVKNEGT